MDPDYRLWGTAQPNTRHNSKHTPFSIPKLLTAVFAITASCSALVLDPSSRFANSLGHSRDVLDNRLKNADIGASKAGGKDASTTSTTSHSHSQTATVTPETTEASTTASAAASSTSSTAPAYTGIPHPFDIPLGSNFTTTTCPTLFNKIIADPAVQSCVPISLLIQGSRSFYQIESSESGLDKTMQISCNVISESCNELFQSYAATVASSNGCKAELSEENSRVQELFYGLISYLPIYNAACLQVSSTDLSTSTNSSEYCLIDAIENTNSSDLSLYTLPLGQTLSGPPTCSSCTQKAMSIFVEAARNLTSPLSVNYLGAAKTINAQCGANFVDASFTPIAGSDALSGAGIIDPRNSWIMALIVAGLVIFL